MTTSHDRSDPDSIARRAADALHARAGDVAATEDSLARLLAAEPAQRSGGARRWRLVAGAAAAVVVALVVGVIAIRMSGDGSNRRVVDSPPATDSAPAAVDTVDTVGSAPDTTVGSSPASSSDPAITTTTALPDVPAGTPTALTNGLTITPPSAGWTVTRSLDRQLGYGDAARAETITDLQLPDRSIVRVVLTDVEPDWPDRTAVTVAGDPGFTAEVDDPGACQSCTTLYGSVVSGVARRLDADTWVVVESTPGEASLNVPDQLPVVAADVLLRVAESATYDPAADRRVAARAITDVFGLGGPQCADSTASVTGAPGAADLALFTCDGVLAVYDGETGERIRLVKQFTPPGDAVDPNAEGSGPAYIDGITISPDGRTLFHSEGPEPISGTTFATDLGTPDSSTEVAYPGWWPAVDPTGRYLAVSALDMVIIQDLTTTGGGVTIPMEGGQVAGPKAFSADGRTLAVEMFGGTIAVIDLATSNVTLVAADDPRVLYHQPRFTSLGLEVVTTCCTGSPGDAVSGAILGLDGTVIEGGGGDGTIVTPYSVVSAGNVQMSLRGTDLVFDGQVIATGVLQAALLPTT